MSRKAAFFRWALMWLDRLGRFGAARVLCAVAVRVCRTERAEFRILLAHFTAETGDFQRASTILEEVAADCPGERDALLALAGINAEKEGNRQRAIELFERALATNGDASEEYRADVALRLQHLRQA